MWIMDFGNDDNFGTSWLSNPEIKKPWYQVNFGKDKPFTTVVITEGRPGLKKYRLEYMSNGVWKPVVTGEKTERVKIHRFER